MSEDDGRENFGLGVFGRASRFSGLTAAEVIALGLSALWLLGVTVFFFVIGTRQTGGDPMRGLTVIFAIFMPIGLIWVATMAANSARQMREEARRLERALDAMRNAYVAHGQAASTAVKPSVEKKLDQILGAQREAGEVLATFTSIRMAEAAPQGGRAAPAVEHEPDTTHFALAPEPAPVEEDAQPRLELPERVATPQPVTIDDFILAMNFPKTAEDTEGFRALRKAMQDTRAAGLLQASQDVLTLLSKEGIYMDDLQPDPARPELWRRFAEGERGRTIAALGGIRDRSGIALTAARMRKDHIFRDTAHHFLRRFDTVFSEFAKHANDDEIVALADTRTARAFMLLGRVAGTFD